MTSFGAKFPPSQVSTVTTGVDLLIHHIKCLLCSLHEEDSAFVLVPSESSRDGGQSRKSEASLSRQVCDRQAGERQICRVGLQRSHSHMAAPTETGGMERLRLLSGAGLTPPPVDPPPTQISPSPITSFVNLVVNKRCCRRSSTIFPQWLHA